MKSKGNILFLSLLTLLIIALLLFGLFVSFDTNNRYKIYKDSNEEIKEIIIDNPSYEF